MSLMKRILFAAGLAGGGVAAGLGAWNMLDRHTAEQTWRALKARQPAKIATYDPAMVDGLPEVARRYFSAAIAPGTPLHQMVELEMTGSFLLDGTPYPMVSDQIMAPPHGFVWRASAGSGAMRFGGSDGYLANETSWTRFRLLGILPLAHVGGTSDHARAAAARMALETIWTPAALLPQTGAVWREISPDVAEVQFPTVPGIEPAIFVIDGVGNVVEARTMRWSDANPERVYQLQPFGGRMLRHARHQGFTIPIEVEIGNMFGTSEYQPFFTARVTRAQFGLAAASEAADERCSGEPPAFRRRRGGVKL